VNVASATFLLCGLAVAVLYNLNPRLAWRQAVLLMANLAFLATFSQSPSAWMPYVGFMVLGYASYLLVRKRVRGAFAPLLIAILFAFFCLKKYTFLPSALFLGFPYVTLGLSYVLFRVLHLLIDTRDRVIAEYVDPLTFLNYTLNFTAIISGPIQRFEEYAGTQLLAQRPRLDIIDAGNAIERIVFGYFKISVLGFVLQTLQTRELAGLELIPGRDLSDRIIGAAAIGALYPLYLFCNFSGYTDIVIGVARGFRLVLPENFDRPFESTNFLDFWSRWHMSLSNWLKTYVYGPLVKTLMQRFPNPRLIPYWGVFAFFFTFFLIGAWHGRTSVFMVYGVLLGLGVSMNKLYQILMVQWLGKKGYKALGARAWYRTVSRGLTFTYFAFSLIWFWSNWGQMGLMLRSLGIDAVMLGWLLIFAAAPFLLATYELLRTAVLSLRGADGPLAYSRYVRVVWSTALVVVMVAVLNLLSVPAPEVIYKAF